MACTAGIDNVDITRTAGTRIAELVHEAPSRQESSFESFFRKLGVPVVVLDNHLRVLDGNRELFEFFGKRPVDMYASGFPDLLHPRAADGIRRRLGRIADGLDSTCRARYRMLLPSGDCAPASLIATAVRRGADGGTAVVVVLVPDHPKQRRTGEAAALNEIDGKILQGLASGASTAELADKLYLSRQGVEYHINGMLRRFKAKNRPALISRACSLGLLSLENWPPEVLTQ